MNLRESNYTVIIKEDMILPFEEKTLASGLCDFALPMKFIHLEDRKKLTYQCEGYISIAELKLRNIRDVFEVIEKTLISLNKSREFLINPNKIRLDQTTVYYNLKQKNIKIAYVPEEAYPVFKRIMRYITSFDLVNENNSYLSRLEDYIFFENPTIEKLIDYVGEMRRDVYLNGVK